MSIEQQTEEVDKVKRSANGIIVDPVTLPPDATRGQAREMMDQANISGVPITASTTGKLVGIITRRDLRFLETSDTADLRGDDPREPRDGTGDCNA